MNRIHTIHLLLVSVAFEDRVNDQKWPEMFQNDLKLFLMPKKDTNGLDVQNDQKWLKATKNNKTQPKMTKNNKKMTQNNSRRPKLTKNDAKKQSVTKNYKSHKIT